MNTAEVKAALRARFCAPEWSCFFEVADATGARHSRWADAVAMNLYPSRGLSLHGFEIKVSRSDWLRELKDPTKSAPVQQYCDYWWIVAPPGIVRDGELPPTWGLYDALPDNKLRQIIAAPKLQAKDLTRDFMAALIRRAGVADQAVVDAAVQGKLAEHRKYDEQRVQREIEQRSSRFTEMQKKIAEIEDISGVAIQRWSSSKDIGRAVKAVLASGVLKTYGGIADIRNSAADVVRRCEEAMQNFGPDMADESNG
jgi:hypothetical protein